MLIFGGAVGAGADGVGDLALEGLGREVSFELAGDD